VAPGPPKKLHTREQSGIRLDRQLRWWHDGEPVEHPKIIEAFNRGLSPTGDGRFILTFGRDWCFVAVEDAAYGVLGVDELDSGLSLRLSDRTSELLDPATLAVGFGGVLHCRVKRGRAKARFSRDAQFALGSRVSLDERGPALAVAGRRIPLPAELAAALA